MSPSYEVPVERLASRSLHTCPPDTPLADAARMMVERQCSSILVVEHGEVVGIWTESDALHVDLADTGQPAQAISAVMSTPVQTVLGTLPAGEVALQFKRSGVRHLLVVTEAGSHIGILSQTDIVLNQGTEFYLRLKSVDAVLSGAPLIIDAETPMRAAIEMIRQRGGDAAIVRYADGVLGIVTQRDIVRVIAHGDADCTVATHASRPLRCVAADQSLYSARQILAQHQIRHIGVTSTQGELCGLVSFSDILDNIEHEYVHELQHALRERDEALWESRYHLRLADRVFESTLEGVMVTDANGVIERVNPAFSNLTGYSSEEAVGCNARMLSSGMQSAEFYRDMWRQIKETGAWQGEIWNRRKDGEHYLEHLTISGIADDTGRHTHYAAIFADITQRKQAEARLAYLATHDVLTGLPNRSLFEERLEQAVLRAQRTNRRIAALFLDLDRFKLVNDTYGHATGDELLKLVAERLKQAVRESDTVARLGGDEFTLIIEDIQVAHQIVQIAQKLVDVIGTPYEIGGRELYVTPSIGISVFPDDAEDAKTLQLNADRAMYGAKEGGKNGFRFFTQEANVELDERLRLEHDLRHALEQDELILYYQPKVDLASSALVGMEALVRWQHPTLGLLGPDRFIPIAEESAMIIRLGQIVLHSACVQGKAWLDAGLAFDHLAVNVSIRQLLWDGFLEDVARTLAITGFPLHKLQLELTESQAMARRQDVERVLRCLADWGIGLAIDDFGTGYASFAHLGDMPFDTLKVDRSLVVAAGDSARGAAVLRAIVAMANALQLTVVMEGVETEAQAATLAALGGRQVQGWLFGRPMPDVQMGDRLKQIGNDVQLSGEGVCAS
ncbi:MAG: EAL domain-containing protein [Burkholderiales bacterium]|nr:EAL domain-containing protein [Burkholderiales bacterium]